MTSAMADGVSALNDEVVCPQPGGSTHAVLRVLEGPQAGASLNLDAGQKLSIGSSLDNDVVLRGESIAVVHATLTVSGTGASVSASGGEVELADGTLQPGQSAPITWWTSMRMGTTVLQIDAIGADFPPETTLRANTPSLEKPHESGVAVRALNDAVGTAGGDRAGVQNEGRRPTLHQGRALLLTAIPLFAILVSLVLGRGAPASVEDRSLARLLSVEPFHTLTIDDSSTPLRVSGFLQTREQGVALRQQLLKTSDAFINSVEIGEQLAERVSDVYRVNGVDASVVALNAHAVTVNTALRDEKYLQSVTAKVRNDVPQLEKVVLKNAIPASDLALESRTDGPGNPGKRVAMIVSESPAYVVTSDRSRYFVGAILPSGHRIAGIERGRVALEKNGATTFIQF